jgi:opacity protein-like surface antigen
MNKISVLIMALLVTALPALAQTASPNPDGPTPLELTLAYSEVHTNAPPGGCGCFWMEGGKLEANAHLYRSWSVVAEVAGQHADNISASDPQLSLISYLFGPRYTYHSTHRLAPFAQVLVGGVHGFDAFFPGQDTSGETADAFAMAAGGGLNINLSRHLAVRPFQADYFFTQLPNNQGDRQNNFRLSAGIVFRFPHRQ